MTFILNLVSFIIFVYLIIYGVYLLTINLKALVSSNRFLAENAPIASDKENKLCIIIFANSKTKHLEHILDNLNNQTYDKKNYSTHAIYAKDSNSLLYTPDFMSGAMIHCIENKEFFKKNKALNVFLEKLIKESKFDAYVFLGADRYVEKDFLETVNNCLNSSKTGVLCGKTTLINSKEDFIKGKVISARQKYKNATSNISRRMFDLSSIIDSENCIITSDILEKTGRICFETREDELKYSLFLASNGIRPMYCPYIETFSEVETYNPTTSGFGVRLALFKYYLKLMFNKPWHFIEFCLSLMQPNISILLILYFTLLYCSFKYISSIELKYILHLGGLYIIIWCLGLFASKLNPLNIIPFLLYPFYSFGYNFKKITKDVSRRAIQKSITEEKNIKSATMDAYVTDGEKNVQCKMDLISEDGMRRIILRFRKKRIISDESIRMFDALQNISKRVAVHGLTLKVCQNCKFFESVQDGTVDSLRGQCLKNLQVEGGEAFDTLIWNTCSAFKANPQANNIDNLGKK